MEKKHGTKMSIFMEEATKEEIERLARKIGITPSMFCRNLVCFALEEAQAMERVGVLQSVIYVEELRKRLRKKIEEAIQGVREMAMKSGS